MWDEQGIHQHTAHASQLWHWHAIDRWYESDRLIAVGIDKTAGTMLPKAALSNQQIDELTTTLRSRLGEPRGTLDDAD